MTLISRFDHPTRLTKEYNHYSVQGCKQEIDMTITLTTKQIMAMADFVGLKVEPHGLDINDETEYTIEPRKDKETGRVHVFYCTEYPEEGAIQLD